MDNKDTMLKAGVLHEQEVEGLKKLTFYQDKIMVLEKRLSEISGKYTAKKVLEQVADLKEALFMKRREIEALKKHFSLEESSMVSRLKNMDNVSAPELPDIKDLQRGMETMENEMKELWERVNVFLSTKM
jgi:hypothetical protein